MSRRRPPTRWCKELPESVWLGGALGRLYRGFGLPFLPTPGHPLASGVPFVWPTSVAAHTLVVDPTHRVGTVPLACLRSRAPGGRRSTEKRIGRWLEWGPLMANGLYIDKPLDSSGSTSLRQRTQLQAAGEPGYEFDQIAGVVRLDGGGIVVAARYLPYDNPVTCSITAASST